MQSMAMYDESCMSLGQSRLLFPVPGSGRMALPPAAFKSSGPLQYNRTLNSELRIKYFYVIDLPRRYS